MFMGERPYRRWFWILNIATREVVGVLMRFMGGWGGALKEYQEGLLSH